MTVTPKGHLRTYPSIVAAGGPMARLCECGGLYYWHTRKGCVECECEKFVAVEPAEEVAS